MRTISLSSVDDYIDIDLTHSIHTSGRKSFKGCRRRWDWLFNGYYYPKTTAKPLEFGVAFHKGMEILYHPDFWNKPRETVLEMAIQEFRKRCIKQLAKYEEYWGEADAEIRKDYEERLVLGEQMFRYHDEYILPEFREKYRPIGVEVSFEVPITDEDGKQLWCKCKNCFSRYRAWVHTQTPGEHEELDAMYEMFPDKWQGLPVSYGGRVDCVMIEIETGRQWIFDWKTAAQLSTDRETFLLLDDQISSYVWAFRVLGLDCAGFVYVEQRKADGSEPEPMKSIRLGRRFSVSKSSVACGAEVYERTVAENDPEAYADGLYDEFIQYLRENQKLHAVFEQHRNEDEIAETQREIAAEAQDMIDPNLRIYKNAGRFSCQNCAFQTPCLEKNGGGDYMYALETMFEKRRYHYWVDTESSTESKGNI